MLYQCSKLIGWLLLRLYFRIRLEGRENVPKEGGCIIVANHTSFLDPFLLGVFTPRPIHFVMYAIYYSYWLFHWYCKRTYCLPVKKDGKDIASLKQALRVLKDGAVLGIFPEGERSFTGQLQPPEPGTALIALKAKVPIVPVGIRGAYEALPRGAKFPKPGTITLTFGTPFRIEEYVALDEKNTTADIHQDVMAVIMNKIAEVCSAPHPMLSNPPAG